MNTTRGPHLATMLTLCRMKLMRELSPAISSKKMFDVFCWGQFALKILGKLTRLFLIQMFTVSWRFSLDAEPPTAACRSFWTSWRKQDFSAVRGAVIISATTEPSNTEEIACLTRKSEDWSNLTLQPLGNHLSWCIYLHLKVWNLSWTSRFQHTHDSQQEIIILRGPQKLDGGLFRRCTMFSHHGWANCYLLLDISGKTTNEL